MHKLSRPIDGHWIPHSHSATYCLAPMEGQPGERLLAGVPGGDPAPFAHLVVSLEPPYFLLYVLHTPRGEGDAGRYQSPPLSRAQFEDFMHRFGTYLSSDARFDLWAHSAAQRATVVWDRHNQLFAYGPLDGYAAVLDALGFARGDTDMSFPHQHHYRQEFDSEALALLAYLPWSHTTLRPEDEQ